MRYQRMKDKLMDSAGVDQEDEADRPLGGEE